MDTIRPRLFEGATWQHRGSSERLAAWDYRHLVGSGVQTSPRRSAKLVSSGAVRS